MRAEERRKNAFERLNWFMAAPHHALDVVASASGVAPKLLPVQEPVERAVELSVDELTLYAPATDPIRHFPARIASLENLRCLRLGPSIDPRMLAEIGPSAIPPSVTALGVATSRVAAQWPSSVELPNVTDLRTDGALAFIHRNFPNLRAVSVYPTRNGRNFEAVLACRELTELQLLTVRDSAVFAQMAHLPLSRVGLLGGRITALEGIGALKDVTWLRLHNLSGLKSIAPLRELAQLEELEIRYCRHIEDIEHLANLPRLRGLQVVACGAIGLSKLRSTLDRLEQVSISGSS